MKIHLSPQLSPAFLSLPLAPVAVGQVCLFGSSAWSIPVQRDSISTLCPKETKIKSHRGIRMGAWMVWEHTGSLEHCSILFWGAADREGGPPTGLPADEGPRSERSGGTSVCRSGRCSPIN